jgi:tetrapyrrole methylase family protein/MazG family protein
MIDFTRKDRYGYDDLVALIHLLRSPGGCPWDREQTHRSIRRNLLEEAYEAAEAIDEDDPVHLCEELGDVLTQVVFHSDIERDAGRFTLDDVCDGVCKKMILRHPHVFGQTQVSGSGEVLKNWEEIKREEKGQKTDADTLRAVAKSLPALWRADKLRKKAAQAGFAWPDADAALDKLSEEVGELRRALAGDGDPAEELGDVLFAAVCAGAFRDVDPEDALHAACEKFIRRFAAMEALAAAVGRRPEDCSEEELAGLWEKAAGREKHNSPAAGNPKEQIPMTGKRS